MNIKSRIEWNGMSFEVDWEQPRSIGIPFRDGWPQVNCFHAPPFKTEAVQSGNFVGDTREGAPVNFKNVLLNPHGNGTHTECIGHITKEPHHIHEALKHFQFLSRLITVRPKQTDGGERQIRLEQIQALKPPWPKALLIRTLPNSTDKKQRVYSGNTPPSVEAAAMQWIVDRGIQHLLIDLPSVDPEEDGGALTAHKIFWQYDGSRRTEATITELIFVDNEIRDGLYLLHLQVIPFVMDAAPSRPVLYALNEEN